MSHHRVLNPNWSEQVHGALGPGAGGRGPVAGQVPHDLAGELLAGDAAAPAVPVDGGDDLAEACDPELLPDGGHHGVDIPVEPLVVVDSNPPRQGLGRERENIILDVTKLLRKASDPSPENI